jgi:hypothetical protein
MHASNSNRREFLKQAAISLAGCRMLSNTAGGQEKLTAGPRLPVLPRHEPIDLDGVHAYPDRISVAGGESIRFHVSSTHPYELQVCRLGSRVDDPEGDEILHTFQVVAPKAQPIHPGSYVLFDKPLSANTKLTALTLECWVRRWHTPARQCLLGQFDEPDACGFALFIEANGAISFYLGDGSRYDADRLHTSKPGVLSAPGKKVRYVCRPARWHHVVAIFDGKSKQLWVDGKQAAAWDCTGPLRPGQAALRLGAQARAGKASGFVDADIAMPVIYAAALSGEQIQARFKEKALQRAEGKAVLGCWPLTEERGEEIADVSGHARHGRIINRGTWMIGGPSFNANAPRFGSYEPRDDAERGDGLRLASDDLYDCRWQPTHEFRLPANARSGIYVARIRFKVKDETRLYHAPFIVRKAANEARAPIAFLCATNTWKAYSATPFAAAWPGLKRSIGNQGYRPSPSDPSAYCFYRTHAAGQPAYQMGFRLPWPVVGPYTLHDKEAWDNSHLCRADRFAQVWLENEGYNYDVLSDSDLDLDRDALKGYKALFIVGHSEYWSIPAYEQIERFLNAGGAAVVLSGNTAFWRVSVDAGSGILECRKTDGWGHQIHPEYRGECWHSQDFRRGSMLRECGYPAWKLLGLEFMTGVHMDARGIGPYRVVAADHPLFHEPIELGLKTGACFGKNPERALPQPIGHECDVRVSTLAKFLVQPAPEGGKQPEKDPPGITLLAEGIADWANASGSAPWDYFQRQAPLDKRPLPVAAEMILWKRPAGGSVFHAGSISAGWTLAHDAKWAGLLKNVLHAFGVAVPKK